MTDIVERLRNRAFRLAATEMNGDGAKLAKEAADEIERLRAAQQWRPIETAPIEEEVIIRTEAGSIFAAARQYGVAENEEGACWPWCVSVVGVHPECWTNGVCWEVNADGERSDQPTHWLPLPTPPEEG